jgi:hypothetical protein
MKTFKSLSGLEITVNAMKGKHIKQFSQGNKAIKRMLWEEKLVSNINGNENITEQDIDNLELWDLSQILLEIRFLTYPEENICEVPYNWNGKVKTHEIDISESSFAKTNDCVIFDTYETVLPQSKFVVRVAPPKVGDDIKNLTFSTQIESMLLIWKPLKVREDKNVEILDIDDLSGGDYAHLQKFVASRTRKIDTTVELTNPSNESQKVKVDLLGSVNFFLPFLAT